MIWSPTGSAANYRASGYRDMKIIGKVTIIDGNGRVELDTHNTVLDNWRSRHAKWMISEISPAAFQPPNYIAVGNGTSSAASRSFTKLVSEFARKPISSRSIFGRYDARLVANFIYGQASGTWNEVGLVWGKDKSVNIATMENEPSTPPVWTTHPNNSIARDAEEYMEGASSLRVIGSNSEPTFRTVGLSVNASNFSATSTTACVQFWYYINSASLLTTNPILAISSSTVDGTNELLFTIDRSTLSDGWNFLSIPFSSATQNGLIDLSSIVRVKFVSTKSGVATERLDHIRFFDSNNPDEQFFARLQLPAPLEKNGRDYKSVIWTIRIV